LRRDEVLLVLDPLNRDWVVKVKQMAAGVLKTQF
jgi:hypothetical protein